MRIELTKADLQAFVEEQVRTGQFASPAAVIEAGLARLMLDPEPAESDPELEAALDRAEADVERGDCRPLEDVAAELRRKYLAK